MRADMILLIFSVYLPIFQSRGTAGHIDSATAVQMNIHIIYVLGFDKLRDFPSPRIIVAATTKAV